MGHERPRYSYLPMRRGGTLLYAVAANHSPSVNRVFRKLGCTEAQAAARAGARGRRAASWHVSARPRRTCDLCPRPCAAELSVRN
jgi:hypothetical protein